MDGVAKLYETEAAVTRERIADTIDELQVRLSPKAILDNAVDSLNTAGAKAAQSVRGALAGHPIALGAAGLAVGVGLLARSRLSHATVEYGDSYAAYADFDDGYAANLAADDVPVGRARAQVEAIQHQAHVVVDDNPLSVLAVGAATGALLGAILPVSATEASLGDAVRRRLVAAGDAAIAAARTEFDVVNLSLAGGVNGLVDRSVLSLVKIVAEAGRALTRPVSDGSPI